MYREQCPDNHCQLLRAPRAEPGVFFLLIFLLSTYELNKYAINECIVEATGELIALDP